MDLAAFFEAEFAEHHDTARRTETALARVFADLVATCAKAIRGGGKLLFFGNGGSAADAQHLATELTIRYVTDRAAIAAIALTTDTAALAGKGGGALVGLADHLLVVPSDVTARIQEMHITLGQMLCGALEIELGFAKPAR